MTILEFPNGQLPKRLPWATVRRAQQMMRNGYDLHDTARIIGVRAKDLDVSLWRELGSNYFLD